METLSEPIFLITDAALAKLVQTATKENIEMSQTYLRVAVVPGGCSGLTYDLGWDTVKKPDDTSLSVGSFTVVIDPRSSAYIEGTTLDFSDGLEGKGFHFENPQAIRNCACGESFGL